MALFGKILGRTDALQPTPPRAEPKDTQPAQGGEPASPTAKPMINAADQARQAIAAAVGFEQFKRFPNLPGSDEDVLAQIGRSVCARLDAHPAVGRVPATNIDMFVVRGFVSAQECAEMVSLIDADARRSTMLTGGRNEGHRTSSTCDLSSAHPLVARIEKRISDLLGLPLTHSETVQGQRYEIGERFGMHNDYFAGGEAYSETIASEGGQRTWTAMVYLNQPEAGGFTNFPRAFAKMPPVAGALLTWNNNDKSGLSNPYSHHEGMSPEAGRKYILTKWFREREWRGSGASDALRV